MRSNDSCQPPSRKQAIYQGKRVRCSRLWACVGLAVEVHRASFGIVSRVQDIFLEGVTFGATLTAHGA